MTPTVRSDAAIRSETAGDRRTAALYRAALGPVNTAQYLAVFARFDAEGRRTLQWHTPAALLGLVWLLFRRLWMPAMLYAGVALLLAGLLWWQWTAIRAWPAGVQAGVLASLLLVHLLLTGLTGYALVHHQVQKRLLRAVAQARSLDEACAMLAGQAPKRPWRQGWAAIIALVLVAAGLWGWNVSRQTPQAVVAASAEPVHADAPTLPSTPAAVLPVGSAAVPLMASAPDEPDAKPEAVSDVAAQAVPPVVSQPVDPVTSGDAVRTPQERGYGINVGLFADPANAQRAYQALLDEGLPATLQVVSSARGNRTRVRAGPFSTREGADAAAQRIRQLGLEAVVFGW